MNFENLDFETTVDKTMKKKKETKKIVNAR